MKMKKAHGGILLALFLICGCLCGGASAADIRMAILPGEGERAPGELVIAQLEATLSQEPGVTLLERAEVMT